MEKKESIALVMVHPSESLGKTLQGIQEVQHTLRNRITATYMIPDTTSGDLVSDSQILLDPDVFDPNWHMPEEAKESDIIVVGGLATVCVRFVVSSILKQRIKNEPTFHMPLPALHKGTNTMNASHIQEVLTSYREAANELGVDLEADELTISKSNQRNPHASMRFYSSIAELEHAI